MRIVVQRVLSANVEVENSVVGEIDRGLLVLVGVGRGDSEKEAQWLAEKTAQLRLFSDENDKMNLSLGEVDGSVLAVSQFTLLSDCRKGRRPAFTRAADPADAERIYEFYMAALRSLGVKVQAGIFGADMKVSLVNDGPVTFVIDRDPEALG